MKTLFYIDRISEENENYIWEAAFKRHFEEVYSYTIGSYNIKKLNSSAFTQA